MKIQGAIPSFQVKWEATQLSKGWLIARPAGFQSSLTTDAACVMCFSHGTFLLLLHFQVSFHGRWLAPSLVPFLLYLASQRSNRRTIKKKYLIKKTKTFSMSHHWLYYLVKELSRHTTRVSTHVNTCFLPSFFITKETDRVEEEAQLIVRVKQNERTTFSFVFLVDWSDGPGKEIGECVLLLLLRSDRNGRGDQ